MFFYPKRPTPEGGEKDQSLPSPKETVSGGTGIHPIEKSGALLDREGKSRLVY